MDSHKSLWSSDVLWPSGQEEDVYEVESMVPLPEPYPFTWDLNDRNAIVVNTSIAHVSHKKNGHILKVVSKISLPTPPYSVSILEVFLCCFLWGGFQALSSTLHILLGLAVPELKKH